MLAVNSPVIERVSPSNFRFDSHVKLLASPLTFVMTESLVAFDILGTFITSEPSELLKLPER